MVDRLMAGVLALLVMASPALAHTGAGVTAGLSAGLLHPLSGFDHALIMATIGIWAAYLGGRAVWAVPAAFVAMMALGAMFASLGTALPFIEAGIAFSIIAVGALLAFGIRMPVVAGMAIAGMFALFHGYAHGAELSVGVNGLAYGAGFCAATAGLHGAGLVLGLSVKPSILRWTGAAVSAAGLALMAAG